MESLVIRPHRDLTTFRRKSCHKPYRNIPMIKTLVEVVKEGRAVAQDLNGYDLEGFLMSSLEEPIEKAISEEK